MVTSIGVDAEGELVAGELEEDGALALAGALAFDGALAPLAPVADDAAEGLDAAAGPEADDAPPDEVAEGSELELPPLHPPTIAAIATAITPTDKCPFMCEISVSGGAGPGAVAIIVCNGLTRGRSSAER
ncbi:hypothetical protein [Caballeronia temeraria]|uniref:hypothetical protein n=1 Tax=Caballeronia temeraria TaxID=1777137 RepID=UPI001FC998ED|nr:hypothetical protein [Caballeronia temeraria]